jgi:phosphocarrier protein
LLFTEVIYWQSGKGVVQIIGGNNMRTLFYTIKTPVIHARYAGSLTKEAQQYRSEITLYKGDQNANAKGLFSVLRLGIKQGDLIKLTIEGDDENIAAMHLLNHIWANY